MPQGFQIRHTRGWRKKARSRCDNVPVFRHAEAHHTVTAAPESLCFNSERSGHSTSPRGPRSSSVAATKWGPRLDGEIITATRGIKSNCAADLSFIRDFSQLTFSRCDAEKTRPTTELSEKVMFKLSRVPRWLLLYYELTFATLWGGAARLPAWTCAAWHEFGLSLNLWVMFWLFLLLRQKWINKYRIVMRIV